MSCDVSDVSDELIVSDVIMSVVSDVSDELIVSDVSDELIVRCES